MDGNTYTTEQLDHLGIVAGICRQIGLIERVDEVVGETGRKVGVGQAVQAMVLNGLGFVGRALYLTPEFLANKPVDILIGEGLSAEDFNEDSLGRALDRLYEAGVTEVFAHVAAYAVGQMGIASDFVHLDSTSFSLHGEYELAPDEDARAITVTYGYSRDRRPDLKQVVVSLIVSHQASLPRWFAALDGNQADATSFPQLVKAYLEQLKSEEEAPCFVADTALYSEGTLQQLEGVRWVTRVPGSITEVKTLYRTVKPEDMRETGQGDYRVWAVEADYGGVPQRWVLVFSEAAQRREARGLRKQIDKERQEAEKVLRRLARREYPSPEAVQAAVETAADAWRFHIARVECVSRPKYNQPGRPAAGQPPDRLVWQPVGEIVEDDQAVRAALQIKGKFVIATNDLDGERLPAETLIDLYKGQNATVERGFRFLKDPLFFAHSLFLKKPSRIMALLMVMGLCLLVYAIAEHQLRAQLTRRNETLPDQKGKPTQRITMRRVFQVFEGIHILTIHHPTQPQRLVLNLTELHYRILNLLGPHVEKCYFLTG